MNKLEMLIAAVAVSAGASLGNTQRDYTSVLREQPQGYQQMPREYAMPSYGWKLKTNVSKYKRN